MAGDNLCPVCKSNLNSTTQPRFRTGAYQDFDCPRCGEYRLSYSLISMIDVDLSEVNDRRAILSHWIRMHQSAELTIITQSDVLNILKNNHLPSTADQLDNLILFIGNHAKKPSGYVEKDVSSTCAIIGAFDENDVRYHLEHLWRNKLINTQDSVLDKYLYTSFSACLTHEGWDRYYELQRSNKDSRLAFMAMQYDNKLLQELYSKIIIHAVEQTGFKIQKVDENNRAGSIDDKMRVDIRRSKFVIADLTDENRGAYWEAGFATGLGIEVIYICERDKFEVLSTHFDTNHQHTVKWDKDPKLWEDFANRLKATIRETIFQEAKMGD